MKRLKTIIKLVKTEYKVEIKGKDYNGLCCCANALSHSPSTILTEEESQCFVDYLQKNTQRIKKFYQPYNGFETKVRGMNYCWKVNNIKSRINWLDKHIKLNS